MIDDVARAQIAAHMEQCNERHTDIKRRFLRLENILYAVAGSAILTLIQVIFRVF